MKAVGLRGESVVRVFSFQVSRDELICRFCKSDVKYNTKGGMAYDAFGPGV